MTSVRPALAYTHASLSHNHAHSTDLELALESTKFVRKVTESEPLASFVVAPHQPTSAEVSTDAEWLE